MADDDAMRAEQAARFEELDRDPVALAWARSHVEEQLNFVDRMHAHAEAGATSRSREAAQRWRTARLVLRRLIGGDGCVIAAFDERRAQLLSELGRWSP